MKWFDRNGNWAVPVLWMVFALGWLVAWIDYYFDSSSFCLDSEAGAVCAREWFGALSGYVAAIVAAPTLYFLWKQIDEQRKQTQFMLGDGEPTVDAVEDQDDTQELVIRIVNWNRRAVLVLGLFLDGIDGAVFVWSIKIDERRFDSGPSFTRFDPPIILNGWEDRQDRPHFTSIKLVCLRQDGGLLSKWPESTVVNAQLRILGEKHKPLTVAAKLVLAD